MPRRVSKNAGNRSGDALAGHSCWLHGLIVQRYSIVAVYRSKPYDIQLDSFLPRT